MLRRSFRFGLLMGLLGGAAAAVVRAVQARPTSSSQHATPNEWTPIPEAEPVVVPPRPTVAVDALQEPVAAPPTPEPAPEKAPVEPKSPARKTPAKKKAKAAPAPWVAPVGGECPVSHPVKAKLNSKIFHLPGGLNYARTTPDRCYTDAAAAEADGLRQAKR